MSPRKLALSWPQKLGRRVDGVEAGLALERARINVLDLKFKELRKELATAMHSGNFEAMYRLEREENIQLRKQHEQWDGVPVQNFLARWIGQLEEVVERLRPRVCTCTDPNAPPCWHETERAEERRIVGKFREEVLKGLGKGEGL